MTDIASKVHAPVVEQPFDADTDPEFVALRAIATLMRDLHTKTQRRIATWVWQRWGDGKP